MRARRHVSLRQFSLGQSDDSPAAVPPTTKYEADVNIKARLLMYAELSKARLSALVVVTAGAGYAAAGSAAMDPCTFAALTTGTTLAACSANTYNQWIERDRDKTMKRTCERPLPSGRLSANEALGWGVFSTASSMCILTAGTNPLTAGLGAFTIGLYALPYTLSKPVSEWNTWTGAVVGAIPPVMGWAATGGSVLDAEPLLLSSTLFLWQFPHFFSLAWLHRKDYSRGGHQMVPVNDPDGSRTGSLVFNYSLALLPLPVLAAQLDVTTWMFACEGLAVNSYAVYRAYQFKQDRTNDNARQVFRTSLWYLPLTLGLFLFHRKYPEETGESGVLDSAKSSLSKLCPHEAMVDSGKLCPNVPAVKVVK